MDLRHLRLSQGDGGDEARHLVEGEGQGFFRFFLRAVVPPGGQPLAGGGDKGADKAPDDNHSLHTVLSGFAARLLGYKGPQSERCSQKGKRIKQKKGLSGH